MTFYKYVIGLTGSPIVDTVITNYKLEFEDKPKPFAPIVLFQNAAERWTQNHCENGVSDFWRYDKYRFEEVLTEEELFALLL